MNERTAARASRVREQVGIITSRYWERLLAVDPLTATATGDERFDHLMPDPGPDGLAALISISEDALQASQQIEREHLDTEGRINLDILVTLARRFVNSVNLRVDHLEVVDPIYGPVNLLSDLATFQRADTPERLERYLERLARIPRYVEKITAVMREALDVGRVAPQLVVDRSIVQVRQILDQTVASSPSLSPVPKTNSPGREAVEDILRSAVLPAYETYLDALIEYRLHARKTVGLCYLPDGLRLYAALVEGSTTLPWDIDELHELGLLQLRCSQEERLEFVNRFGYADHGSMLKDHSASSGATLSPPEILALAEEQVRRGWRASIQFLGIKPSSECVVREVDSHRQSHTSLATYRYPSPDGSRPGALMVNTLAAQSRPIFTLAPVIFHEASPGHHFQASLEVERGQHEPFRTFGAMYTGFAFIEGWGVYSERLADEMGLYRDRYERLAMLNAQAWRAARLVVDTGIHAKGWSRDRALEMLADVGLPATEAAVEVDRYISRPAQALTYRVGQGEIESLRDSFHQAGFSDLDFHRKLLSFGSVPLATLRREFSRLSEIRTED